MPVYDADDSRHSMLSVVITETMQTWVSKKTDNHVKGGLFNEDLNKQESIKIGYSGDAVFQNKFPDATHVDISGYDFIYNTIKVENKSWWTKFRPKENYFVQIPVDDLKRSKADIFVFIAINNNFTTGVIAGWIECAQYKKHGLFRKKGERREGITSLTYVADCYEMIIKDLHDPDKMLNYFQNSLQEVPLWDKLNTPYYDRIRAMSWNEHQADLVRRQTKEIGG